MFVMRFEVFERSRLEFRFYCSIHNGTVIFSSANVPLPRGQVASINTK